MQSWCQQAAHGEQLICHPAVNAPDSDELALARLAEFEVLSGVRLQEALQQAGGLRLGAMSRILASLDPVLRCVVNARVTCAKSGVAFRPL